MALIPTNAKSLQQEKTCPVIFCFSAPHPHSTHLEKLKQPVLVFHLLKEVLRGHTFPPLRQSNWTVSLIQINDVFRKNGQFDIQGAFH